MDVAAEKLIEEFGDRAFKLICHYLDDGSIVAEHDVLMRLLELLYPHSQILGYSVVPDGDADVFFPGFSRAVPRKLFNFAAGKRLLLQLAKDKSHVWRPTSPSEEIVQKYGAPNVACTISAGTVVLGAPVGSEEYRRAFCDSRVDELGPTFENVGLLEDAHVALALLRACLGALCL